MPKRTLDAYFSSLAQGTAAGVRRAKQVAVPGSPADVFADHQAGMIAGAQASSGQQGWQVSSTVLNDSEVDWATSFASRSTDLGQFTDFVFDPNGRLITWTVTPGTPLAEALGRIDRTAQYSRVAVTVKTGYRTGSGELQLAYHARSRVKEAAVTIDGYVQRGSSRSGVTEPYQLDLSPGAASPGLSIFTRSRFGGRLLISSYYPVQGSAAIPIDPRPWPNAMKGSP